MTIPKVSCIALACVCLLAHAQKSIGLVSTENANVSGTLETSAGVARIISNGTVTAQQTATVKLTRGGTINVCTTSTLHLSQSTGDTGGPLLLSLDHGALELNFLTGAGDAILTPEMRLQPATAAPLDLRLRVVASGDTCIENRGTDAPALILTDPFGESSYILRPQQHVLFEHGSLKEVVDNETSPCGCPPTQPVVSVSDSGVSAAPGAPIARAGSTVATSSDAHPFPAAQSEGLSPSAAPLKVAQVHVATDMTLAYNSSMSGDASGNGTAQPAASEPTAASTPEAVPIAAAAPAPAALPAAVSAQPVQAEAPPPPPPPTSDLAHAFVRFYRWIFHRKS